MLDLHVLNQRTKRTNPHIMLHATREINRTKPFPKSIAANNLLMRHVRLRFSIVTKILKRLKGTNSYNVRFN